jgi:hypothetical protein
MLCISHGPHIAAAFLSYSRPSVVINVHCALYELETEFFLKKNIRRLIQTSKCAKVLQPLPSTALQIHNHNVFRRYLHYVDDSDCYNTTK